MGRQQRRRAEQRRAKTQKSGSGSGARPAQRGAPAPPRKPSSRLLPAGIGLVALLVLAGIGYAIYHAASASPTAQPTAVLPSTSPVDGVACATSEALVYHIHQHIALYENGKPVVLPSSIGIPGSENAAECFYWIHVHQSAPNIIHVESPTQATYNLGDFFDIWKATVATAIPPTDSFVRDLRSAPSNDVTVFVNGKRWTKGYRTVLLTPHAVITVEIGKPVVAPRPFTNWGSL